MKKEFRNPFRLTKEEYKRDLDVVTHYVKQNAFYLSKMTDTPYDEAFEFIKSNFSKEGQFPFRDPILTFTYRDPKTLDRSKKRAGYLAYINHGLKDNDVIAPTLTRYIDQTKVRSIQVDSVDKKKAERSANKKKMFESEVKGNKDDTIFYDMAQTGNKLSNNALSGGYCSASTIMYNPSAHTTLTSTCRITAGYGNTNNEKILAGNRHYYDLDVTLNNIKSICSNADLEEIAKVMTLYGIKAPSVDEVMTMVLKSSRLYWKDIEKESFIRSFLEKLKEEELSAFMYTGDLYSLRVINEDFTRSFIDEFTKTATEPHPNPDEVFDVANGDYKVLASQLHSSYINGTDLKSLKGSREYGIIANTLLNIFQTLEKYRPFLKCFFLTMNLPASVAYFPSAIRKVVLMGDTDSTIFTVQDWVEWSTGSLEFNERSIGVSEAMIFIASQTISHALAIMSANIGVSDEKLFETEMKNEYRFDSFTPTSKAKHYFAMIGRREANSYTDRRIEVKGVHLKNSNAPKLIMDLAENKMIEISEKAIRGEKLSFNEELQLVANIEHGIYNAIKDGYSGFFRVIRIKEADSYKQPPMKSQYQQYLQWQKVWEPTYGTIDPPPYPSLKISTNINNKTDWRNWLDNMTNRGLAKRLDDFLVEFDKDIIRTFYIPLGFIVDKGLPEELMSVIDYRRIILDNTGVFYLVLESLGYSLIDDKINRLSLDIYPQTEVFEID